jgi:apolipoprotein N-acyltransferase
MSKKYLPALYFMLGFGFFMFTRLSKVVPFIEIAILIAPILILRFIRTQPAKRGIWLTLLGFILSMNIALWGLFELDEAWITMVFGLIRSTVLALIWFLPFMLDRLIYPKFSKSGLWSSLIFPVITTAIFFLSSLEGPFDDGSGTLSSFGFGYGSIAFIQIRSILGIWILVFIHSWLFSIINYFWELPLGKDQEAAYLLSLAYPLHLFIWMAKKFSAFISAIQNGKNCRHCAYP